MRRIVLALAITGFVIGGASGQKASDEPVNAETTLKLGEERVPAGEEDAIKELVATQVAIMRARTTMPDKRGQHLKAHGCVEAEFLVRDDIPEEYRLGLFKEARSYRAKIRFSNGSSMDDTTPDVHGMAVKVLAVKGPRAMDGDDREEQDFVLIDSEVFLAPDVKTVLELMKAQVASATKPEVMEEFGKKDPRVARLFQDSKKTIASPLAVQYWSTVPFKLGDRAVKYTAVPAADDVGEGTEAAGKDYLKEAMAARLSEGNPPVTFDLSIIPQTDPVTMPVEDPTIRWESALIPVARITIEPQTFDTSECQQECEEMVYDPWHALAEHRPLGGINRARKAVYPASVGVREASR